MSLWTIINQYFPFLLAFLVVVISIVIWRKRKPSKVVEDPSGENSTIKVTNMVSSFQVDLPYKSGDTVMDLLKTLAEAKGENDIRKMKLKLNFVDLPGNILIEDLKSIEDQLYFVPRDFARIHADGQKFVFYVGHRKNNPETKVFDANRESNLKIPRNSKLAIVDPQRQDDRNENSYLA